MWPWLIHRFRNRTACPPIAHLCERLQAFFCNTSQVDTTLHSSTFAETEYDNKRCCIRKNNVLKDLSCKTSQLSRYWTSENQILQRETAGPAGRTSICHNYFVHFDAVQRSVLSREYATPFIKRNSEKRHFMLLPSLTACDKSTITLKSDNSIRQLPRALIMWKWIRHNLHKNKHKNIFKDLEYSSIIRNHHDFT